MPSFMAGSACYKMVSYCIQRSKRAARMKNVGEFKVVDSLKCFMHKAELGFGLVITG